jgi:hypothetical protein
VQLCCPLGDYKGDDSDPLLLSEQNMNIKRKEYEFNLESSVLDVLEAEIDLQRYLRGTRSKFLIHGIVKENIWYQLDEFKLGHINHHS